MTLYSMKNKRLRVLSRDKRLTAIERGPWLSRQYRLTRLNLPLYSFRAHCTDHLVSSFYRKDSTKDGPDPQASHD